VAACADAGLGRNAADEIFTRYAGMDNYRRLLEREGVPSPGAVAITGPDNEIEKQLARLAGAGVTELWPIIFPVGDDPGASRQRTRDLLAALAAADPA
jgi:hypothetical protein